MKRGITWAAMAAIVPTLFACAIVSSVPAGNGGVGIAYMLPRALLPVELVHDGSAFELRVTQPVLVGDAQHSYVLQRSGNIFSSDNVTISVNPATGVLSALDVKSTEQTLPAIVTLSSGLKAEAADVVTTVMVFRGLFDPGWDDAAVNHFNQRLGLAATDYAARLAAERNCKATGAAEPCPSLLVVTQAAEAAASAASAASAAEAVAAAVDARGFAITVEGGAGATRTQADCSAGFCYRINMPHVVTVRGPGTSNSAVFGLPNRSPSFVMPLERWAFVKTSHDVKLEEGVFKSITTDRPSSALAVAAAPLDVASAALSAVGELVQLKFDLSGKEKALADAKVAEIQAKAALDKALLDKTADPKAEAAILGVRGSRDAPVLSVRVGAPGQLDATKNLVGVKASAAAAQPAGTGNPTEARSSERSSSGSGGSAGGGAK